MEENAINIYYNMDNSLEYQALEPQFFEIASEIAPAIDYLINAYPKYVSISELPLENDQDRSWIASQLWERGLVITE